MRCEGTLYRDQFCHSLAATAKLALKQAVTRNGDKKASVVNLLLMMDDEIVLPKRSELVSGVSGPIPVQRLDRCIQSAVSECS